MNNTKGINTIKLKLNEEDRHQKDYLSQIHKLNISNYNENSKKIIQKYMKKHDVEGSSVETKRLYLTALNYLCECFPNKDILTLSLTSDGDMGTFSQWLEKGRGKRTIAYYLNYLRTFYKTYLPEERVKKEMKFVSKLMSNLDQKLKAEDYGSLEEVFQLVEAAQSKRDQAIIIMGWESALRAKSFSLIKIKHIKHITGQDGKDIYKIHIPVENIKGKREKCQPIVFLSKSVPYLQEWLKEHRFKDNPNAWLFYSRNSKKEAEKLSSRTLSLLLKRAAARIEFKKKISFHCLRNWRTKWLIEQGYNSEVIKKMNGWSKNSNMLQTYSDFGEADVEKTIAIKEGLITTEEEEKNFDPVICPRCGSNNLHNALFCKKCWMGLRPESTEEIKTSDMMTLELKTVVEEAVKKYINSRGGENNERRNE